MNVKVFLELVEIKTKIASIFPFFIGVAFSLTYFKEWNVVNTLLFFAGMLIFDMTTTAINNLMDYKKAKSETYKREKNVIGREGLSEKKSRTTHLRDALFNVSDWSDLKLSNRLVTSHNGWIGLFHWDFLYVWPDSLIADAFRRGF